MTLRPASAGSHRWLVAAFTIAAFVACSWLPATAQPMTTTVTQPFLGVTHTHIETTNPRLLDMHLVTIDLGVPGIVGECGGGASCGTCHVWVDPQWADRLPVPDENELEMLEFVEAELRTGSRLGCQIEMQDELDGIVIAIPPLER